MRKADLKRYEKLLLQRREEVMERVRALRDSEAEGSGEDAPDLGDRALTTASRDMLYLLSTGERAVLRWVEKSLARVTAGTYGKCLHCDGKIQKGRLDAVPWARYCIQCQELLDRGEFTDPEP